MFFVLAPGRSGTTTIARVLSQHEECACFHERKPALIREASEYFCGDCSAERIAELLKESRSPLVDGKIYGEANQKLSLVIPVIREVFPEAQFIWLTRDGRDVVSSMYYRGWYDPTNENVVAKWHESRLQGDRTGDYSTDSWNALDRFDKCCWIWKKYNEVIQQELTRLPPTQWRSIRLENAKTDLPKLCDFLGLSPNNFSVARHNEAVQPVVRWNSWTPRQREAFDEICGTMMDQCYPRWRAANGAWRNVAADTPDGEGICDRIASAAASLRRKIGRRLTSPSNRESKTEERTTDANSKLKDA